MDRETTNVAKAQNGFINGLIKPSFVTLQTILPKVQQNLFNLNQNLEKWGTLEDEVIVPQIAKPGNMTNIDTQIRDVILETDESNEEDLKEEKDQSVRLDKSYD